MNSGGLVRGDTGCRLGSSEIGTEIGTSSSFDMLMYLVDQYHPFWRAYVETVNLPTFIQYLGKKSQLLYHVLTVVKKGSLYR